MNSKLNLNLGLPSYRHTFRSMGSTVEILLVSHEEAEADAIGTFAVAETLAAEWERTFSRFRADSEISRLNAQAGWPVAVSERLFYAIDIALDGTRLTGGLFDPTILPALIASGYDRTFDAIATEGAAPAGHAPVPGVSGIRLDPAQLTVTLPSETRIDLGGVVKGLYADLLAGTGGWAGGAISAGGDLRVWGEPPHGDEWLVGVEDTDDPSHDAAHLRLDRGAVATSGINRRAWRRDGALCHHLIDPRSGRAAESGVRTATAISTTAVQAEIAATALAIGGWEQPAARALFRQAVVILTDGQIINLRGAMGRHVDVVQCSRSAAVAA
jgi:thiamine biosynthesis lipoprotein